jgi:hypothetical protein
MSPLSFSDQEMDRITAAAALLPASRRDTFLRSVAGRVAGLPCVGMAEIESAIAFVLNNYGIGGGNQAFKQARGVRR